ncbi:MAG: hypothetical protein FJ388_12970, partial [Verrucomicrobia bacterium]|nr:hypothetical protein [Verrucomicrobiota bacterium]
PLVKCLSDANAGVQMTAGAALVKIGQPAVQPLIQSLSSSNKECRLTAARALGDIGDKSAMAALTLLLADGDGSVKSAAELALAKLNAKAGSIAPATPAPAAGESKSSPAAAPVAQDATIEFKSKQGFSFEYPAHWMVATKEQTRGVGQVLKTVAPNIKQADMSRIAVLVYNPTLRQFAENLNVVVTRGAIPINQKTREEYAAAVTDGYRKAGGKLSEVKTSIVQVAGRDAMTIRFLASLPRVGTPVRHWQVSVPGKRQTYIVTCSAQDGDWPRLEPVFERMINSLRIEPDTGPSWDGLLGYPKGVIVGAVLGVVIGLIIVLFFKPFRR